MDAELHHFVPTDNEVADQILSVPEHRAGFTEQLTQALAVIGHVPAASQTSGTVYVSSPADMGMFHRVIALINVGVMPSGTFVAQWFAANNVAFTTAGTVASGYTTTNTTTALSTTTLTVGTSGATRVEKFEVRADQLPTGMRWAQLQISVSSAGAPVFGALVLGGEPNYKPANQFEATAYATGTTGSAIVDQAVVIGN